MPPVEIRGLNDHAVLWAIGSLDGYGRYKVTSPVEILVRWEDAQQESGGTEDTVEAWPATAYVAQAVSIGSLLWHGRLRDLPDDPTELHKVVGTNSVKDYRGQVSQRTLTLIRYTESLPDIE